MIVINLTNGKLVYRAKGEKYELIPNEGVRVENEKVVEGMKSFYGSSIQVISEDVGSDEYKEAVEAVMVTVNIPDEVQNTPNDENDQSTLNDEGKDTSGDETENSEGQIIPNDETVENDENLLVKDEPKVKAESKATKSAKGKAQTKGKTQSKKGKNAKK